MIKKEKELTLQEAIKIVDNAENMLLRWWEEEQVLSKGTQSRYSKRAPYGLGARPPLTNLAEVYDHLRKVVDSINLLKLNVQQWRDWQGRPVNSADRQRWFSVQIQNLGLRSTNTRDVKAPTLKRETVRK